jgi:hypothetical protein
LTHKGNASRLGFKPGRGCPESSFTKNQLNGGTESAFFGLGALRGRPPTSCIFVAAESGARRGGWIQTTRFAWFIGRPAEGAQHGCDSGRLERREVWTRQRRGHADRSERLERGGDWATCCLPLWMYRSVGSATCRDFPLFLYYNRRKCIQNRWRIRGALDRSDEREYAFFGTFFGKMVNKPFKERVL